MFNVQTHKDLATRVTISTLIVQIMTKWSVVIYTSLQQITPSMIKSNSYYNIKADISFIDPTFTDCLKDVNDTYVDHSSHKSQSDRFGIGLLCQPCQLSY